MYFVFSNKISFEIYVGYVLTNVQITFLTKKKVKIFIEYQEKYFGYVLTKRLGTFW